MFFNFTNEVYIEDLNNKIKITEIESYVKKLKEKYNITYNVGKLFNPSGMFYVKDKPEENEIIRIFPTEGNILDEEVNIGVISIDTNKIDEKDFYRYVEILPSLEEIYNSYVGMIDKNPSSKSIIVVEEEIS